MKIVVASLMLFSLFAARGALTADQIRIRDPFVVTDAANGRYLLVSSDFLTTGDKWPDGFGFTGKGVKIYESKDLKTFSEPRMVLEMPTNADCRALWAPEMHHWKDKWYILVTVNYRSRPTRGTWTFVGDSPEGPFRPCSRGSITPEAWCALDGTLFVEDGRPYMVFCHEWVQIGNGEICAVEMSDDLSRAVGEPRTLFKATDGVADFVRVPEKGHRHLDRVTDGPFLFRSPTTGRLSMIWSNVLHDTGYAVLVCESASVRLAGPWVGHRVLYGEDGGHGMIFSRLDGVSMLALHQPNTIGKERARFIEMNETRRLK